MRKWKKINGFLILFIAFFSACAGFSSWNVNPSKIKDFNVNIDISKNKVAYFKDGNTKREFTTVAGALKAAADRKQETLVVVNPDTTGNVSITDCTIADKVTLIINYKAVENYQSPSSKDFVNDYTGDKDGGLFGDTAGSTSKIKLSGARKIESGGSLIIGGETGQYNVSLQGGTRGSCAELDFVEGGSIDCHGKIISYGFIHDLEEGKRGPDEVAIEVEKTGSVSRPLTRYSWFGGETVRNIKGNVFPCNVFDLPNIRVPMLFDYGSTLTGKAKVNAQNTYVPAEASIIARDNSEGFLQLKSGKDQDGSGIPGSALFNADDVDTDKTSTSYSSHKTSIKTKGDFEFSGVSVSVGETIDTKKNYLPISGIFDISVGKGVGKIKYKTKLLPGASLRILPEARLTMEQNFVAYQNSKAENGNTFFGGYQFSKPATIYNEGTIRVKSGFDGLILTNSRTGCCSFDSSYGGVNDCKEFDSTSKAEGLHGILTNQYNYSTFKFFNGANRNRLAQRYAIDGTTSYISKGNENAVANRTYTSSATSDGKYGWTYNNEYKSYPIVIDTNGNDSAVDSNGQKYIENYGSGTTLSNLTSKDPDKTFDGFYYDQACTKALDKNESGLYYVNPDRLKSYLTNNCLKVYAKWISGYTLHYEYRKYSPNHLSKYEEINRTEAVQKTESIDLNPDGAIKLSPDYYFEYNGSIPANQFNCYYDTVESIKIIDTKSNGNSVITDITSDNISNLSNWPTTDWQSGDTISVIVSYAQEKHSSKIEISGEDSLPNSKGESKEYSVNDFGASWFSSKGILVETKWLTDTSKNLNFNSNGLKANLSQKAKSYIAWYNGSVKLSFSISFLNTEISSCSKTIKYKH